LGLALVACTHLARRSGRDQFSRSGGGAVAAGAGGSGATTPSSSVDGPGAPGVGTASGLNAGNGAPAAMNGSRDQVVPATSAARAGGAAMPAVVAKMSCGAMADSDRWSPGYREDTAAL